MTLCRTKKNATVRGSCMMSGCSSEPREMDAVLGGRRSRNGRQWCWGTRLGMMQGSLSTKRQGGMRVFADELCEEKSSGGVEAKRVEGDLQLLSDERA